MVTCALGRGTGGGRNCVVVVVVSGVGKVVVDVEQGRSQFKGRTCNIQRFLFSDSDVFTTSLCLSK